MFYLHSIPNKEVYKMLTECVNARNPKYLVNIKSSTDVVYRKNLLETFINNRSLFWKTDCLQETYRFYKKILNIRRCQIN